MSIRILLSGAFSLVPLVAAAATVAPADFTATATAAGETAGIGPISGGSAAGFCSGFKTGGCDALIEVGGALVGVDFVSPSSFDIGLGGSGEGSVSVILSDLGFADIVTGVAFDLSGGSPSNPDNIAGFVFSPDNDTAPEPPTVDVAFDQNSITIDMAQISNLLFADGVALRFDIAFEESDGQPPAVPLPASGALLLAGMGAFAALRRRR